MKSEFELRRLPREGTDYVQARLALGLRVSRAILSQLRFDLGTAWAIVPKHTSDAAALKFQSGGVIFPPNRSGGRVVAIPNTDDLVSRFIVELALNRQGTHSFWEEADAELGDPAMERATVPIVSNGKEVYYHSPIRAATDLEQVKRLLQVSRHPRSAGYLSQVGESIPRSLSTEDIVMIAAATYAVIVSAYDLEGHVIWTDPTASSTAQDFPEVLTINA